MFYDFLKFIGFVIGWTLVCVLISFLLVRTVDVLVL
jgi:hypothetical protein